MRNLILAALVCAGASASAATTPTKPAPKPKPLPPGVAQLQVEDLHCKTCARKLTRKLYSTPGVVRVVTSMKLNRATITLQKKRPAPPHKLWDAALAAGQQPVDLRVADKQYTAKHFPKAKAIAKTAPHAAEVSAKPTTPAR